jgi:Kef-type K+ transport system membrane component KefB
VILGAFAAGAIVTLVDRDRKMTHPQFRLKLQAAGFGIFVPFFFVATGLRFNLDALFAGPSTLARVPVFLAALLLIRGLPAALYRPAIGGRRAVAAGLLQATNLGFIVVASQIGMELVKIGEGTAAALVSAGLFSVLLFPLGAVTLLYRVAPAAPADTAAVAPVPVAGGPGRP